MNPSHDSDSGTSADARGKPAAHGASIVVRVLRSMLLIVAVLMVVFFVWTQKTPEGKEFLESITNPRDVATLKADEAKAVKALDAMGFQVITERNLFEDEGSRDVRATSVSFLEKPIDEKALASLKDLYRLNVVNFSGTNLTDDGLNSITGMRELTTVSAAKTKLTDAATTYLEKLTGLECLLLPDTQVGDSGIARIVRLKNLKILDLSGTKVTDSGVPLLIQLPEVAHLLLERTAVTDASLDTLVKMASLRRLSIRETKISPTGRVRLKQANPSLMID